MMGCPVAVKLVVFHQLVISKHRKHTAEFRPESRDGTRAFINTASKTLKIDLLKVLLNLTLPTEGTFFCWECGFPLLIISGVGNEPVESCRQHSLACTDHLTD